ncbi:DUF2968 domain-containing protein [Alcaligenaceae bacterium SJ-26]|nr:DUF2968 domain-containing protein [Alcaligenaceae bacterium SJ-26]
MKNHGIRPALLALAIISIPLGGCAQAQDSRPADAPVVRQVDSAATPDANNSATAVVVQQDTAAPPPAQPEIRTPAAEHTLANELQRLIQAGQVHELRTTYNGQFGASLLFQPSDLRYYVALFQQKNFWRVIRTDDFAQAENTYRNFSRQTVELAQPDIERIRFEAEYAHTERQLAASSTELSNLQNDLATQRLQERSIAAQQAQARQEADRLNSQQQEARQQLRALQRQIEALEAQQNADTAASGNRANRK